MSWTKSTNYFPKTDLKRILDEYVDELKQENPFMENEKNPQIHDQVDAAADAAWFLAKSVPGPWLQINLSGHANGTGVKENQGYAAEFISITVNQAYDEPDWQKNKREGVNVGSGTV